MNKLVLVVLLLAVLHKINSYPAKCIRSNCYHSTVLDEAGILQKKDNHIDDKKGHLNTHGSRISNQVSSGSMIFNTSSDYEEIHEMMKEVQDNSHQDIVEGDIKLTPVQAAIYKEGGWDALVNSEAWHPFSSAWTRYIPYEADIGIGKNELESLKASISQLEAATCLRFVQRTYESSWLKFINGGGCYSLIGKVEKYGAQEISLGADCDKLIPVHEIMHALGRYHEQSRPDRDDYIKILIENIYPYARRQFDKYNSADTQGIPYDYSSLMHYPEISFSKNRKKTIKPLTAGVKIGQRDFISQYDALHINLKYCPEKVARLVDGSLGPYQGRIEVYWNGQWGTVCYDGFDQNDANAMCKFMGYPDAINWYTSVPGTGPVWFSKMNCFKDDNPYQCMQGQQIGYQNCDHTKDVGITCTPNIRLKSENSLYPSGRVEAYVNGLWGTVCSDSFDFIDADVVCRQLGYPMAFQFYPVQRSNLPTGLPILLDDLECTGNEKQITHCKVTPVAEQNCNSNQDVYVTCMKRVRLTGNFQTGNVEVFFNGQWGTVCTDSFSNADADVVCHELGYARATFNGLFTPPSLPMILADLGCSGHEQQITQCNMIPIAQKSCSNPNLQSTIICGH